MAEPSPAMPPADRADTPGSDHDDDEQVVASKPASYYFFKSTPSEQATQFAPQRVEVDQVAPAVSTDGTSVWNKGNTWEERDLSRWATDTLKEIITPITIDGMVGEDTIKVESVETPKCHASIVFVRGKKRYGYELSVLIKWTGLISGVRVDGKIEFSEVCDDEDDFPVSVSAALNNKEHECARMAVRKSLSKFQSKLREFDTLLRQK